MASRPMENAGWTTLVRRGRKRLEYAGSSKTHEGHVLVEPRGPHPAERWRVPSEMTMLAATKAVGRSGRRSNDRTAAAVSSTWYVPFDDHRRDPAAGRPWRAHRHSRASARRGRAHACRPRRSRCSGGPARRGVPTSWLHRVLVLHPDLVDVRSGKAVDEDQRHLVGTELIDERVVRAGHLGHHQAVDASLPKRPDRLGLANRILRRVREQQRVPGRARLVLDTPDHVGEDRLARVRDDEADRIGLGPSQGPCHVIGRVARFGDRRLDALARGVAHLPRAVHDVRDRRDRDIGDACDVADRGQLAILRSPVL